MSHDTLLTSSHLAQSLFKGKQPKNSPRPVLFASTGLANLDGKCSTSLDQSLNELRLTLDFVVGDKLGVRVQLRSRVNVSMELPDRLERWQTPKSFHAVGFGPFLGSVVDDYNSRGNAFEQHRIAAQVETVVIDLEQINSSDTIDRAHELRLLIPSQVTAINKSKPSVL